MKKKYSFDSAIQQLKSEGYPSLFMALSGHTHSSFYLKLLFQRYPLCAAQVSFRRHGIIKLHT